MKKFDVIDISGDVGIKAFGKNLEEVFVNAALGMYSLITDIEGVEEKKAVNIKAEGESMDGLLVSWLNELVFQFDTYGFIGRKIEIKNLSEKTIEALISGDEFDTKRHERRLLIKAATYHRLKIEKTNDFWEVNVIFDI